MFHPAVSREVEYAYNWYERQRAGLGDEFLAAVEDVFRLLGERPEAHQVIYRAVRRAATHRFPYGIFYRIYTDRIEIVAVHHDRRDPQSWRSRL